MDFKKTIYMDMMVYKKPTCTIINKLFRGQSREEHLPMTSTGRDKCNTTASESIATSPNLQRRGITSLEKKKVLFSSMISFAWICTAVQPEAESKPAKLTRDPLSTIEIFFKVLLSSETRLGVPKCSHCSRISYNYLHYKHFNTTETRLHLITVTVSGR